MKYKVTRSKNALREGINFTADGLEGALYPRWNHIIDSVVLVSDYGQGRGLLELTSSFPVDGGSLSRDPRLLLQSLRWLLESLDVDTGANLRLFEQDEELAQIGFDELYDTQIHHGLEAIA